MARVTLDSLRFPEEPEVTYYSGPISFQIEVVVGGPLKVPVVFDHEKRPNRLSVVDKFNKIVSIPCFLINYPDGQRVGKYLFRAITHSRYYSIGELRVFGSALNLRGEPIFIRKLYKLAIPESPITVFSPSLDFSEPKNSGYISFFSF